MNRTILITALLAVAASLQGCVVFTYGEDGLQHVRATDAPAHLAAALRLSSDDSSSDSANARGAH